MIKRLSDSDIITDEMAEGAPDAKQQSEPLTPAYNPPMPVSQRQAASHAPLAETGLLSPVTLTAEGRDNSDSQDATRTMSEAQPATLSSKQFAGQHAVEYGDGFDAPSVLIVEDTIEIAEILQATLRHMKYTSVHESHGTRAIERYNELQPDVVLLDIGLPDVNGWQVLEHIKEHQRQQGSPMPVVIMITAFGDPANRLIGKFQDVEAYLIKPFTPDEVAAAIRRSLSLTAG